MKKKILITIAIIFILAIISIVFFTINNKNTSNEKSNNSTLSQMKEALNKAVLDLQMQYINIYMEDNEINENEFFTLQKLAIALENQGYCLYNSPNSSKKIASNTENESETFSNNQVYYVGVEKSETDEYLKFKILITNSGVNVSFP